MVTTLTGNRSVAFIVGGVREIMRGFTGGQRLRTEGHLRTRGRGHDVHP